MKRAIALMIPVIFLIIGSVGPAGAGGIPHEPAYVNGITVTITALEVPRASTLPQQAQADFFQVVYPVNPFTVTGPGPITPFTPVPMPDPVYWASLGISSTPQCEPCNHEGTPQIDADDYHDHVLDSMPTTVGYRPIWHVFLVFPAYTDNPTHNQAVNARYATHLPATSEQAVLSLLADKLSSGEPVAIKFDTGVFFLCAIVSSNAAGH